MREFSAFEREVIGRLLNGGELPDLISKWFRTNIKLMIRYGGKYNKFEYFASKENYGKAHRELTEIILLLYYLDKHELLHKYTPPATTERDLDDPSAAISLGVGKEKTSFIFLDHSDKYLSNYIRQNDNFTFRANEELRVLARNNFIPREERNHRRSIEVARGTNIIAIVLGILSLFATAYTTSQANNQNQENNLKDALLIETLNSQKVKIDSLEIIVKKISKPQTIQIQSTPAAKQPDHNDKN